MIFIGEQQAQFVTFAMCPKFLSAALLDETFFIFQRLFKNLSLEVTARWVASAVFGVFYTTGR